MHSFFSLPASAWRQLAHPLKLLVVLLAQQGQQRPPRLLPLLQVVLQVVRVRLERLAPLGLQVRLPV
ncbi:hypothetical protein [Celeribacter halophilus]|uniref:hypothetical protein n=1 Tax=Celeribacter halophilus TaxID=576117 RepID=UPI0012E37553|nr:hypothetical protein [Celeribacter halophilus]